MRLTGLIVVAGLLVQCCASSDKVISKRAITPAPPRRDTVEGSGNPPPDAKSTDTDGRKQTGYGSDDEDSIEGSGKAPARESPAISPHVDDDDEEIEGSGGALGTTDSSKVIVHQSQQTTTSTTTEASTRRMWETIPTEEPRPTSAPSTKRPELQPTERPASPDSTDTPIFPFHGMLKPGIFAAVVGGTVVGLLMAILLVMFIVYRMRKRDEGSYALEEPKQRQYAGYAYTKASSTKEFYA